MSRKASLKYAEINFLAAASKTGATGAGAAQVGPRARRRSRHGSILGLNTGASRAEWEAKTQAGCRFWQNVMTGECVTENPTGVAAARSHVEEKKDREEEDDTGDDVSMPETFDFLLEKPTGRRSKIELLSGSPFPEKYKFMQKSPRKPDDDD